MMFLKRTSLILTLAVTLGLAGTASASSAPGHDSLLIRHQMHGCHTWSANSGAFKTNLSVTLHHGGWLAITNNDVMPHTLVLTSGPSLRIAHPKLGHMGASLKITLTKPGVYRFTTKPGNDYGYMAGMKTIGADNVLKLTVTVS
jgi:plastocyanin